ncbi:unnamed protein product [Adineta ricciae]|uniref:Transcription initiation factor IIE subunit beta n=1 Tax=Adineta ricciae TaxID=249248 RepID=A0A815PAL7_ADIRI|nr:unnamed protein product [Adineta ricciae]CAF1446576.1 unnamed protein product [Adineta ricciae]
MQSLLEQKKKDKPLKRLLTTSTSHTNHCQSNRIAQLVKVVQCLRSIYLANPDSPYLSLDELEKQCEELSLDSSSKYWLASHELPDNPRIHTHVVGNSVKFRYKPPLHLDHGERQVRSLLSLFKTCHQTCAKPITVEDVHDSTRNADRSIQRLLDKDKIAKVMGRDRKEILVYKDHDKQLHAEFLSLFRNVSMDDLTHERIRRVLVNHGQTAYEVKGRSEAVKPTETRRERSKPTKIRHNEHVSSQLEFYRN